MAQKVQKDCVKSILKLMKVIMLSAFYA